MYIFRSYDENIVAYRFSRNLIQSSLKGRNSIGFIKYLPLSIAQPSPSVLFMSESNNKGLLNTSRVNSKRPKGNNLLARVACHQSKPILS